MASSDKKPENNNIGHSVGGNTADLISNLINPGKQSGDSSKQWVKDMEVSPAVEAHSKGSIWSDDPTAVVKIQGSGSTWKPIGIPTEPTISGHSIGANVVVNGKNPFSGHSTGAIDIKTSGNNSKKDSSGSAVTSRGPAAIVAGDLAARIAPQLSPIKWRNESWKDNVTVSGKISTGIASGDISVDTTAVKKTAEDLKKINKTINSDALTMDKALNTLDQAWDGAASEKVLSKYKDLLNL